MAQVNMEAPVGSMTGQLTKQGVVFRKKNIRGEKGEIIQECRQEVYKVTRPRDYKKNPPTGEEARNIELWAECCRRAKEETDIEHPKYAYWRERWESQLKKPDPMCPENKKTKTRKCYYRFDCFVRVAIRWELNLTSKQD